ncbi:MAG: phenylalanine--tRNA ligase subunit alpha [Bacteroidia bacterium]|nr:phenylalanine--tRNA ligase subunit alpha [Bacteroidia bacterium]
MTLADLAQLRNEITSFAFHSTTDLELFKQLFIGKKGRITALFDLLKTFSPEEKARYGKLFNEIKVFANNQYEQAQAKILVQSKQENGEDLTLPGNAFWVGSRHPLSLVEQKIAEIFQQIGFVVADGPEIEDDRHNFSALNFEENHPARDMQDTFFIRKDPDWLLRTHTSNVQIRVLESQKPPIRVLAPGRVYRNEAISARSHCFFHQIEGFCVDKDITFADLKQTLHYFVQTLFGQSVQIRLRPSYFPFTEISAEMDISCLICQTNGCPVCKHTGWVEILGCGMIDPNVLQNCGLDPNEYSGFAFGMGVERIAQLLFQVPDIRLYSQNDIRFLQQFTGKINL